MNTNRRDFISALTFMGLGVSILPLDASSAARKAKYVIYINMEGGMSHVDTFDPKSDDSVRGLFSPRDTQVPGFKLNEHFVGLSKHTGKMAVVRSMSVKTGAHEQAQYLTRTSYTKIPSIIHPHLGSWVAASSVDENGPLPNNVTINAPSNHPSSGWMAKKFAPLPIVDPSKGLNDAALKNLAQFNKRADILNKVNKMNQIGLTNSAAKEYVEFYDQTVKLLNSSELEIFDLSKEAQLVRDAYGKDRFGQACLLARRLIEKGKVNFVEINHGGWDTHTDNFGQLKNKLPVVDTAVTALIEDLARTGLLKDTLIVITTEFGRTPDLNDKSATGGRDHWPNAYSSLLIGAGIKGGTVYGATDELGKKVVDKPASIQDFNATIAVALGFDHKRVMVSPEGRPFTIADKGTPILEVLA